MTTYNGSGRARFSLNSDAFRTMAKLPQVKMATHEAAEKVKDFMRSTWPAEVGEKLTPDTPGFTHGSQTEVFAVQDLVNAEGRPISLILVNHPYAVTHQAKTGGFTKAIKAAGYHMAEPKEG